MTHLRVAASIVSVLIAGCAPALAPGFYDATATDDPVVGRCTKTRNYGWFVFQQSDRITAYFQPADLEAYRRAIPARFGTPEQPLIRVSVIDFHRMTNGPTYLEAEVSVLVLHSAQPGWFILTMPVTNPDACIWGRSLRGIPKVVRQVILTRGNERHEGAVYVVGAKQRDFTLTLDVQDPGDAPRDVLRSVHSFPSLAVQQGQVVKYRTLGVGDVLPAPPAYEVEPSRGEVGKLQLGRVSLDVVRNDDNLLHRLRVGQPVAGFFARTTSEYTVEQRRQQ